MQSSISFGAAIAAALVVSIQGAMAHAGHDERVKVVSTDEYVHVEFSLDGDVFSEFDANHDGELARGEYENAKASITARIDAGLRLVDTNGDAITPMFKDELIEGFADLSRRDPIDEIKIIRRFPILDTASGKSLMLSILALGAETRPYVIWRRNGREEAGVLRPDSLTLSLAAHRASLTSVERR